MHDPSTLAFDVKYPWKNKHGYRDSFISIWHIDPDIKGDDDSCGWFMRSHHGDKAVLEKIVKRFENGWDQSWTSEETGTVYQCGMFLPDGMPRISPIGITLELFQLAAFQVFGTWDKTEKFMSRNVYRILYFAENTTDSLRDSITLKFGNDHDREERIERFASIIYGWILRESRPWWKHPRWHVHHWEIKVQPWMKLRRFLLSRCCKCGGRFRYGESPVTNCWDSPPLRFLRGETHIYHSDCSYQSSGGAKNACKSA